MVVVYRRGGIINIRFKMVGVRYVLGNVVDANVAIKNKKK
jgi:hypothetical protein